MLVKRFFPGYKIPDCLDTAQKLPGKKYPIISIDDICEVALYFLLLVISGSYRFS